MTIKDFLKNGRKLNFEINELIKERDKAFVLACGTAVKYDNERVQSSCGNVTENKFINYAEYTLLIDRKIDELYKYRLNMHRVINTVQSTIHRAVLTARYINCDTWEKIAENMDYDIRHIYRIHGQALRKISHAEAVSIITKNY